MTFIDVPRVAPAWDQLRELTPTVSQQVFRAIMDAFARPGTVQRVSTEGLPEGVPAAALPLLALADIMTPIGALRSADDAHLDADAVTAAIAAIGRVVAARVVDATDARYALALAESAELGLLSPGIHWAPEKGTTLVQRVEAIHVGAAAPRWRLTGPGIPPHAPVELSVDGLGDRFVDARDLLVSDYPAGIDSILMADDGELIALSRTTRIEKI
ncbi:phosphonate C-P lyase system protein PhnH [Microbacterium sp. A94]|uniref:phosphonate C-P lyase system protein PhnH n=1 Tax=Microbacterium sp. A94 TaxID=3450717 RepID=UPI003F41EB45